MALKRSKWLLSDHSKRRDFQRTNRLGGHSANEIMVSYFHFVGDPPPRIWIGCRTRIICAVVRCASRRIAGSSTQHVTRRLDSVSVFEGVASFCVSPRHIVRRHAQSFILINSIGIFLVDHSIECIRIPLVVYSVDDTVSHSYLSSHRFSSGFTKDNPSGSLDVTWSTEQNENILYISQKIQQRCLI